MDFDAYFLTLYKKFYAKFNANLKILQICR